MRIFWQASPSISVSAWLQATVLTALMSSRSRYRRSNDYSLVHICKGYPHQDSGLGMPFVIRFSAIGYISSTAQGILPDIEITGIFKITSGNNTLDSHYDLLLRNGGVTSLWSVIVSYIPKWTIWVQALLLVLVPFLMLALTNWFRKSINSSYALKPNKPSPRERIAFRHRLS